MGNPDTFITVIGVVVILLVGYLMFPAKKPKERTLNFSKNKHTQAPDSAGPALALNVFFNFNGHSFDAYEALGVPAGSTIAEIQAAFQKSIQGTDPGSQEFFVAAFNAIKQSK
ncbi:MAG: hypothetical protein IT287_08915 [Bdellovibrionaceae bacterium]|nr:hypothetical protein [Pseudobdellovibrionaceae bacterium]